MAGTVLRGFDGVAYIQTDGVAGTDGWQKLDHRTINIEATSDSADVTTAGNAPWKTFLKLMIDASVTIEYPYVPDDVQQRAIEDAFYEPTGGTIGVQLFDTEEAGQGRGIEADMIVESLSEARPIDGEMTREVTLKPAKTATQPKFVTTGTAGTTT